MKRTSFFWMATITLTTVLALVGCQRGAAAQEHAPLQYTGGEHFFTGILTSMEDGYVTVTLTQDAKDEKEEIRFPAGTELRFPFTEDLRQDIEEEGVQVGDKVTATYDDSAEDTDLWVVDIGLPWIGFTDVDARDYCADPVRWAREQGITNGTSNETFSPESPCTRAQSIAFLWRTVGSPEPTANNPFSDVSTGSYYAKAAAWAAEQGIVEGDSFSPDAPCTRAMAVEFMWKQAGSPAVAAAGFADVSTGASYATAVGWAVAEGITNGTGTDTFSPEKPCTRAQIVTFLYRGFGEGM